MSINVSDLEVVRDMHADSATKSCTSALTSAATTVFPPCAFWWAVRSKFLWSTKNDCRTPKSKCPGLEFRDMHAKSAMSVPVSANLADGFLGTYTLPHHGLQWRCACLMGDFGLLLLQCRFHIGLSFHNSVLQPAMRIFMAADVQWSKHATRQSKCLREMHADRAECWAESIWLCDFQTSAGPQRCKSPNPAGHPHWHGDLQALPRK